MKKGQAEYVCAVNFHKEIEEMTAEEKINYFQQQNMMNQACKANTPHIVLSFHPSEKLNNETLAAIASAYMEGIGFGDQPYLVYHHTDMGHPHLHIVTTLIKNDGSRIDTHNIGKLLSEPIRQKIEENFGLVKAKGRRNKQATEGEKTRVQRAVYGKSEAYNAISKIVDEVLKDYIFTTIGELNAALKQFNVVAQTGKPDSETAKNGGLYYRILDMEGHPSGVPIKASDLPGRPTWKVLKEKFLENKKRQLGHLKSIRTRVEWCLMQKPETLQQFLLLLEKEQIKAVLWTNEAGWHYGITFFDQKTKTAINGRQLGEEMGIAAIQAHLSVSIQGPSSAGQTPSGSPSPRHGGGSHPPPDYYPEPQSFGAQLLNLLLQPAHQTDQLPFELTSKKKRKKPKPPSF